MKNLIYIAGAGLVTVGIGAGVVGKGAFAQDAASTPVAGSSSAADIADDSATDTFAELLAANLGLDPEVVKAALKQTMIDMVDQRAERITSAIESGDWSQLPGFGTGVGHHHREGHGGLGMPGNSESGDTSDIDLTPVAPDSGSTTPTATATA